MNTFDWTRKHLLVAWVVGLIILLLGVLEDTLYLMKNSTRWFGCKSKIHLIEHISRTTGNWVVIRISLWSANQSAAAQRFSARTDVLPLLCDVLPLLCGILHINQVICGKKKNKMKPFFFQSAARLRKNMPKWHWAWLYWQAVMVKAWV